MAARQRSTELMRAARAALSGGQLEQVETLAREVDQMHIPGTGLRPRRRSTRARSCKTWAQARIRYPSGVIPASGTSDNNNNGAFAAARQFGRSIRHATCRLRLRMLCCCRPREPRALIRPATPTNRLAIRFLPAGRAGLLKNHDRDRALQFYQQAGAYMKDLDPLTADRLQDKLRLLSGGARCGDAQISRRRRTRLPQCARHNCGKPLPIRGIAKAKLRAMLEKNLKAALSMLEETRKRVEAANLEPNDRDRLFRQIDRAIAENKKYLEQNASRNRVLDG